MDIRGFIETSFLDWDGKISSVIFLPHCNFKCPFCDNGLLVENPETLPEVKLEAIDNFINQRKDFIDGVVITGGEPTIHPWLTDLIKHFKAMDLLVKLDTNGTNPRVLSELLTPNSELIDYIAMDLKAPLNDKYYEATGLKTDLNKIKESIKIIMASGVDYEFRTTVVPTILDEAEIEEMAKSIAGAKKYALQQFVPDHTLDERLRVIAPHPKEKIEKMAALAKKYVPKTIVRGV
jgi:pyruvate formate lyase activating enzyme